METQEIHIKDSNMGIKTQSSGFELIVHRNKTRESSQRWNINDSID